MGKRAKRLQAIRDNPRAVRPEDLFHAREDAGWTLAHVTGSHHYWRKEGIGQLSIPYKRPHLKRVYVEQALAFIDQEAHGDET